METNSSERFALPLSFLKDNTSAGRSRRRGATLIEFAVAAPLLLLLILGIFDLIKISYTRAVVEAGLIEGIKEFQKDHTLITTAGLGNNEPLAPTGNNETANTDAARNRIMSAATTFMQPSLFKGITFVPIKYASGQETPFGFLLPGYQAAKRADTQVPLYNTHCDPTSDSASFESSYITDPSSMMTSGTRSPLTQCLVETSIAGNAAKDNIESMSRRFPTEMRAVAKIPTTLFGNYTLNVRAAGYPLTFPPENVVDCCGTENGDIRKGPDFRMSDVPPPSPTLHYCCLTTGACGQPQLKIYEPMSPRHKLTYGFLPVNNDGTCCTQKTDSFGKSCCWLDSEIAAGHNGDFDYKGTKCCALSTSPSDFYGRQCCEQVTDAVNHYYPQNPPVTQCCQFQTDAYGKSCCVMDTENTTKFPNKRDEDGRTCCQTAYDFRGDLKGRQCCQRVTDTDQNQCCALSRSEDNNNNTCCRDRELQDRPRVQLPGYWSQANPTPPPWSTPTRDLCCPDKTPDCTGKCAGPARIDECNVCGGNPALEKDECGDCWGRGPTEVRYVQYVFLGNNLDGPNPAAEGLHAGADWQSCPVYDAIVNGNRGRYDDPTAGRQIHKYYDQAGNEIGMPTNFVNPPTASFNSVLPQQYLNSRRGGGQCWRLRAARQVLVTGLQAPTPTPTPTPPVCNYYAVHMNYAGRYDQAGLDFYSTQKVDSGDYDIRYAPDHVTVEGLQYPIRTGQSGMPPEQWTCPAGAYIRKDFQGQGTIYLAKSDCKPFLLWAENEGYGYWGTEMRGKDGKEQEYTGYLPSAEPVWGYLGENPMLCGTLSYYIPEWAGHCFYSVGILNPIPQILLLVVDLFGPLGIDVPIPWLPGWTGDSTKCPFQPDELVGLLLGWLMGGFQEVYFNDACEGIARPTGPDWRECGRREWIMLPLIWILSPVSLQWDMNAKLEEGLTFTQFQLDPNRKDKWYKWYANEKFPLVVYDPEHKGKVESATQLFGNFTFGKIWAHGYAAMESLDLNKDGKLEGDELKDLALWFDANRNGVSEPGEVKTMAETGVQSISVKFDRYDPATGNIFAEKGYVRNTDKGVVKGGSVDWFSMPFDGKVPADTFKDQEPGKPAPGQENFTPEQHLEQIKPRDITKELSGIWEWENDLPNVNKTKYGGTFVLKDLNGQVEGWNVADIFIPPALSEKARHVKRSYWLTGKKETAEGKVSFKFNVADPDRKYMTHSTAVMSADGMTLKGESIVEAAKHPATGEIFISKYAWTAKRGVIPNIKAPSPAVQPKK